MGLKGIIVFMTLLRFLAPIGLFIFLLVTCLRPLTFTSQKGMPMKIIDQLNQIETDFNINYEIDPNYYDKQLTHFYKNSLEEGIKYFELKNDEFLQRIRWQSLYSNKYIRQNTRDSRAVCKEHSKENSFARDAYYEISRVLYENKNRIEGEEGAIKEWLIEKRRSKSKPFVLMHFVGAKIALENKDKRSFQEALEEIKKINWEEFKP